MRYCTKCGTQIADESTVCPQCQTSIKNQYTPNQQSIPKKKFNKLYIVIPLIIIATALIVFVITYFIFPRSSNIESVSDSNIEDNFVVDTIYDTCPEDEYGHHSWGSATCEHPAVCLNCGAYKDNKLGHHDFEYDEETDMIVCWHCNMPKDEYDGKE